jgi:Zn-dependent protease with chaperone function
MAQARFSDGRTPTTQSVALVFAADGLRFSHSGGDQFWPWESVVRADDNVGAIVLRLEPDTGARLHLDQAAVTALKAARPSLFDRAVAARRGRRLALGLVALAGGIVALFLVGVPLAAKPLARLAPPAYEQQLGAVAWAQVQAISETCEAPEDEAGSRALQSLVDRIAVEADVPFLITVYPVSAPFPNAFALPGGRVVVTDDLIEMADQPDEIAGVLAHEIAHLEKRHVLANVIRQSSLGIMADIVLGGGGIGQTIAGASMNVASLQYGREDETEADRLGRSYLRDSGLDPAGMGAFFEKIQELEQSEMKLPELFSSHPDSKRRALEARRDALPGRPPAMNETEWAAVKSLCGLGAPGRKPRKKDSNPPDPPELVLPGSTPAAAEPATPTSAP